MSRTAPASTGGSACGSPADPARPAASGCPRPVVVLRIASAQKCGGVQPNTIGKRTRDADHGPGDSRPSDQRRRRPGGAADHDVLHGALQLVRVHQHVEGDRSSASLAESRLTATTARRRRSHRAPPRSERPVRRHPVAAAAARGCAASPRRCRGRGTVDGVRAPGGDRPPNSVATTGQSRPSPFGEHHGRDSRDQQEPDDAGLRQLEVGGRRLPQGRALAVRAASPSSAPRACPANRRLTVAIATRNPQISADMITCAVTEAAGS